MVPTALTLRTLLRSKQRRRILAVGGVVTLTAWTGTAVLTPTVRAKATTTTLSDQQPNPFRSALPLVIPHAGGDCLYPANTVLAYDLTIRRGAHVVDVDVRMTKDGVLIAFHDSTLNPSTNGSGRVDGTDLETIRRLRAGWNFRRNDSYPFRRHKLRVPTIDEVLRKYPTVLVSIELKDHRLELVRPTCDVLRSRRRTRNVLVGSNNDRQLLAFRGACPEVRTSATMAEMEATKRGATRNLASARPAATVSQLPYGGKYGSQYVSKESIDYLHRHGVAVLAWVVNDPADMKQLIEWGIDGIYTQRPDVLVEVLRGPYAGRVRRPSGSNNGT